MGYQNNWRGAGLILATVLCLLCVHVEARGSGAPLSACRSMTPPHGAANDTLPYELDIGAITTYSSGMTISVNVTGGDYQGFILQARKADGTPVGTFSNAPPNTKAIACESSSDSSMTHANTMVKNVETYTWNSPDNDEGDVYFIATVAQQKVWWKTNIRSNTIKSSGYSSATSFLPEFFVIIVSVLAALRNFPW